MFVKVTAGKRLDGHKGAFLTEAEGPVNSGLAEVWLPTSAFDDDGYLVDTGDLLYESIIDVPATRFHMLEMRGDLNIRSDKTLEEHPGESPMLVHWVWFSSRDGSEAVVTTRNIFILNDSGKTIDRV